MVYGWKPVVIPDEIYEVATQYYDEHRDLGELVRWCRIT